MGDSPEPPPKFSGAITVQMAIPPDKRIDYADFPAVQSTEFSYVVSFFQLQPPGLENAEALAAFQKNPVVPALCIGRYALPRASAQRLLEELTRHLAQEPQKKKG